MMDIPHAYQVDSCDRKDIANQNGGGKTLDSVTSELQAATFSVRMRPPFQRLDGIGAILCWADRDDQVPRQRRF